MAILSLLPAAGDPIPVLSCALSRPGAGVWSASLRLDSQEDLSGPSTLRIEAEGRTLDYQGYLGVGSARNGRRAALLVGGGGGLSSVLSGKHYKGASARLVAEDLCASARESLDPSSQGLDTLLPFWVRSQGRAGAALTQLAEALALSWAITPAGKVRFFAAPDPAQEYPGDLSILSEDGARRLLSLDLAVPDLEPHQTIEGRRVSRVFYDFAGPETTITAHLAAGVLS